MPPFISPESVKELNEVMCVTKDNWTPIMGKRKDAGRKGLVAASGVYYVYMVGNC